MNTRIAWFFLTCLLFFIGGVHRVLAQNEDSPPLPSSPVAPFEFESIYTKSGGDDIQVSQDGSYDYTSPTLTVGRTNPNILFVSCQSLLHNYLPSYWLSTDNGENWEGSGYGPLPGGELVDITSTMDADDRIFYCYKQAIVPPNQPAIWINYSTNLGANWQNSFVLNSPGQNQFNPQIIADVTNSSYRNRLYIIHKAPGGVRVTRSEDHGLNWQYYATASDAISYGNYSANPAIAIGGNGNVYCTWSVHDDDGTDIETYQEDGLGFSYSTDGGVTFINKQRILNIAGIKTYWDHKNLPNHFQFRVDSRPSISVDKTSGTVYIVWTDKGSGDPDILLIKSTNNGNSWSGPYTVNDDGTTNDQWLPSIDVSETGVVNIAFFDSRADNAMAEVWLAQSADGGLTFKNSRVGDHRFQIFPLYNNYFGHKISVTSHGESGYAAWMDLRDGGETKPVKIWMEQFGVLPINSNVANLWNMTGVPMKILDYSNNAVYPTRTSEVFKYQGGYQVVTDLANDRGYWVKFGSAQTIEYIGERIATGHWDVDPGWNITGSISLPVSTSTVQGPVASPFYKYQNGGYVEVSTLIPGGGYWVKSSADGYFTVFGGPEESPNFLAVNQQDMDSFLVQDANGSMQTLYISNGGVSLEMPPEPPPGAHNVRFANGNIVQGINASDGTIPIHINLRHVAYPITVSWEFQSNGGVSYWLRNGNGRNRLPRSGSITINARVDDLVRIEARATTLPQQESTVELPATFALREAFPNPFNPSTELQFEIPQDGYVSLAIYDILGHKVVEPVKEQREAGYHTITWDARNENGQAVASGVYLARFSVIDGNGKQVYAKINKLVLMK